MNSDFKTVVEAYAELFVSLKPDSIHEFRGLVSENVYFKDPFNAGRGYAHFQAVFEKMFADVEQPEFEVLDIAYSPENMAYIRWVFTGRVRRLDLVLKGVSEIQVNDEGKVSSHIDYWDAAEQFYERLPVIGALLRMIKRRV